MGRPILQSCRSKQAESVRGTTERVEQILAIHICRSCADQSSSIVDVDVNSAVRIIRVPSPALDSVTSRSVVETLKRRRSVECQTPATGNDAAVPSRVVDHIKLPRAG